MGHAEDTSQFVLPSLVSTRRTSTGSLTAIKKPGSNLSAHDCSHHTSSVQRRYNPIAGGSWDDNSVGHGSVAARMRRERNRVIRQTKSPSSYIVNTVNTHAHITSTLNLINTTSLTPWKRDDLLSWDDDDDDFDVTKRLNNTTAATKRCAGSLFNIPSSSALQQWEACSIPDRIKPRPMHRISCRNSYTSAYHHSSPTSGCASVTGSDIDSSDHAFFSMTDDSSFFDGDSLFSDTYGVHDTDSGFSTNIYNLLEDGTISCRTPFLNGDWPDSISELDFDCSEQQTNDVANCDAHSDIGPSCSVPVERNRLKKRQVRSQADQLYDILPPTATTSQDDSRTKKEDEPFINTSRARESPFPPTPLECATAEPIPCDMHPPVPMQCSPSVLLPDTPINVDSFLVSPASSQQTNEKQPIHDKAASIGSAAFHVSSDDAEDTRTVVDCAVFGDARFQCNGIEPQDLSRDAVGVPVEQTLASNLTEWNSLPKEVKLNLVEQLSDKINKTMGLQEQMDIIQILGASQPGRNTFHVSIDDIDSHKLSRLLGYLDTHKGSYSSVDGTPSSGKEGELRRSNSDGNIAKSASEAQKEHRRRQRQARRFAKFLKQRQRKESRQQLKEQRSGLFVNEMKLKIQAEPEEDVEVDV